MPDSSTIQPWTEKFRVRSYECSPDGKLSIVSLANYLQEIAGNHARELGLALGQIGRLTWVLHRLRIDTLSRPDWGSDAEIKTWPSGHDGLSANREFFVYDGSGELCARATSQWLLLDLDRRRPVRLPAEVTELRPPDLELPLGKAQRLVEPPKNELFRVTVRTSDLDMNGHVNNARYVAWMMDAANPDATSIDVQFKSEALLGDVVLVRGGADEDIRGVYRYDGRLLALARIV
jgi:medium-chain acyl-[acyl-carrier-protein] hydrolase